MFETRTQSGGSKPNENLNPDKVYWEGKRAGRRFPHVLAMEFNDNLVLGSHKTPGLL